MENYLFNEDNREFDKYLFKIVGDNYTLIQKSLKIIICINNILLLFKIIYELHYDIYFKYI